MLKAVVRLARGVLEAGGSVVGFRHFTEEPAYTTEPLADGVEIRHYEERIAAETTVAADEESARQIGFRRLAGYIFGANHVGAEAQSAVVEQARSGRGEKIAMTAPVAQDAGSDGQWVIRFYMPSVKTMASLPQPDDPAVRLVTVPAETVAVRRFSGSTAPRAVADQAAALMRTLGDRGWKAVESPAAWFYDPPWTLPFLRRNEVSVAVRPSD